MVLLKLPTLPTYLTFTTDFQRVTLCRQIEMNVGKCTLLEGDATAQNIVSTARNNVSTAWNNVFGGWKYFYTDWN